MAFVENLSCLIIFILFFLELVSLMFIFGGDITGLYRSCSRKSLAILCLLSFMLDCVPAFCFLFYGSCVSQRDIYKSIKMSLFQHGKGIDLEIVIPVKARRRREIEIGHMMCQLGIVQSISIESSSMPCLTSNVSELLARGK